MNGTAKIVQIDGAQITIEVVNNSNGVKYTTVMTQHTATAEDMVPYAIIQANTLLRLLQVLDPEKTKQDYTDQSVSELLLQNADYLIDCINFYDDYR